MRKLLSPSETAQLLGVTVGTLAVWRTTGRHDLPFTKVGGRVFYLNEDVDLWLESRKRTCT
ncbi:helix-turn-helix domain-containing protein [Thiomicrorhabdus chilensis]|uniref:helix-turn-helix domain-containing protein n=1 Tax=Thiomicrorhabdus chilensis TaxID=63656 RepID=UPI000A021FCF|nr:helix-turn-helix domain-containing protein [Thiomicrorhabdus chilensis]